MSIETEIGFEPAISEPALLSAINRRYKALGLKELPNPVNMAPDPNMSGRRILWVEDNRDIVEIQLQFYVAATNDNMDVILKTTETIEEMADKIVSMHPEFVLLDGNLQGFDGCDLIPLILAKDPSIKCIGYSNSSESSPVSREFIEKGAIGAVQKMGIPSQAIKTSVSCLSNS